MKRCLIWLVSPLLFALIAIYVLFSGCSSSSTAVEEENIMEMLSETSTIEIIFQGYSRFAEYHYTLGEESYDTSSGEFSISIGNNDFGQSIEWTDSMFSIQFDSTKDTLGEITTYTLVVNGFMSSTGREIVALSASYSEQLELGYADGIKGRGLYLHDISLSENGSEVIYSCDGYETEFFLDSIIYFEYYNSVMLLEDSLDYLSTDWQNTEYSPEITVTFRKE